MDWNVQVLTDRGQIKNVRVYDYNLVEDAKSAALSQTGAKKVICASPYSELNHRIRGNSSNLNLNEDSDSSNTEFSIEAGLVILALYTALFAYFLLSANLLLGIGFISFVAIILWKLLKS